MTTHPSLPQALGDELIESEPLVLIDQYESTRLVSTFPRMITSPNPMHYSGMRGTGDRFVLSSTRPNQPQRRA
jgi:hypothetical protein